MIFGVMTVRNEADIIRVNLLYHLAAGVDQILVVDNGSTDETASILDDLSATGRVLVFARPGAFRQAEITTAFAREAFLRGARWVLPIDADEFWHVPNGRLGDVLDEAGDAGALQVEIVNFIQRREQEVLDPRAVLTMTRRVSAPVGGSGEAPELVESGRISFVGCRYPPKYVSRASIALQVAQGNHAVSMTGGGIRPTDAILCLHAPLRARAGLEVGKVQPDRSVEEIEEYLRPCWHLRRWRRLADEGRLDQEWAANSYREDSLDVHGVKHPLLIDTMLRDAVASLIDIDASGSTRVTIGRPEAGATRAPARELDAGTCAAILDLVREVEGWLRDEEAELLMRVTRRAVAEADADAVVEIGSYCGKSTIVLASAARGVGPHVRVHAIDPHQGVVSIQDGPDAVRVEADTFDRFRHNIAAAGVDGVIEPIRLRSYEVDWRGPISFLFIDGLHDYASVARDFSHFEPHLPAGAYVGFHDCNDTYPGVKLFVAGLAGSGAYEEVERAGSLVVLHKVAGQTSAAGPGDAAAVARLRVSRLEQGISFLMREIAARDRVVQQRDEGIEWLRGVIRDQELTIAELEKGVAWLRKELEDRERVIDSLRGQSALPIRSPTGD